MGLESGLISLVIQDEANTLHAPSRHEGDEFIVWLVLQVRHTQV